MKKFLLYFYLLVFSKNLLSFESIELTHKMENAFAAAKDGRDSSVLYYLKKDLVNVNTEYKNKTLLMEAMTSDSLSLVKMLIKKGADINFLEKETCKTPLIFAIESGNPTIRMDIIKLLIEKKVNLNQQDCYGNTALMIACALGDIVAVESLLTDETDLFIKNSEGATALDFASTRFVHWHAKYLKDNMGLYLEAAARYSRIARILYKRMLQSSKKNSKDEFKMNSKISYSNLELDDTDKKVLSEYLTKKKAFLSIGKI